MRKPDIPDNDVERLKALNSYEVLDILPESDYDDITKAAAEIGSSHMALITLVDKDRQFFLFQKSGQNSRGIDPK